MLIDQDMPISACKKDGLGLALIFISSLLLGIWAVRDTIALRNILLVLGAILGAIYLIQQLKDQSFRASIKFANSLPLLMLGLMFVWVLAHYVFLSRYPEQQFGELTSTWLRAFMAAWLAIGTAVAIHQKPYLVNLLWSGILISFLVLIYQYIPRTMALQNLYAPDWYGVGSFYLYQGKINGVLVGSIMLAGLIGGLMYFVNRKPNLNLFNPILNCVTGIFLASYTYVYIFETRNGIGLEILIALSAILFLIVRMVINRQKIQWNRRFLSYCMLLCGVSVLGTYICFQQIKSSPGWKSMIDDVQIATQIYKYPNWKDLEALSYPHSAPGKMVSPSTYARVAWATAGITIFIPENPLGVGILKHSFPRLLQEKYGKFVDNDIPSTHSAWIDLTLSYGMPGAVLLLGPLLVMLYRSLLRMQEDRLNGLIFMMSVTLLGIYTVGEVAVGHGLEILIYMLAFLATLDLLMQER